MDRPPSVRPGDDEDPEDDPDHGAGDPPWKALFTGSSPRELLARLWDGDPLELGARCDERLEDLALLLPRSRVQLRALARVAYAGVAYRGRPPLDAFLRRRIEVSIHELLDEDREHVRAGVPDVDLREPPYPRVAAVLGIESPLAFRACVTLNGLPIEVRRACRATVVRGRALSACARELDLDPDTVLGQVQTGLRAVAKALGRTIDWRAPGGTDDGA